MASRPERVEVGQVWASNHRGDCDRGERQERHVVEVDALHATLVTPGQPRPTRVAIRTAGDRQTIKGYRLVQDVAAGGPVDDDRTGDS